METSHAKVIRGLGIVTTVIAALCVLLFVLMAAGVGLGAVVANDADVAATVTSGAIDIDMSGLEGTVFADNPMLLLNIVLGAGGALLAALIVCNILALIAGILAIRNAANVQKLGSLFVWAIAGAVASLLGSNIVLAILLVIIVVLVHMDHKAASHDGGYAA